MHETWRFAYQTTITQWWFELSVEVYVNFLIVKVSLWLSSLTSLILKSPLNSQYISSLTESAFFNTWISFHIIFCWAVNKAMGHGIYVHQRLSPSTFCFRILETPQTCYFNDNNTLFTPNLGQTFISMSSLHSWDMTILNVSFHSLTEHWKS